MALRKKKPLPYNIPPVPRRKAQGTMRDSRGGSKYPTAAERKMAYRKGRARMKPNKSSGTAMMKPKPKLSASRALKPYNPLDDAPRTTTLSQVPRGMSKAETPTRWGMFKRKAGSYASKYGRKAMSAYSKAPKWAKRGGAVGIGAGVAYAGYKAFSGGGSGGGENVPAPKPMPGFQGVGGAPMGPLRKFEAGRPMAAPKAPAMPKAAPPPMVTAAPAQSKGVTPAARGGGGGGGMNIGTDWKSVGIIAGAGLAGYLLGGGRRRNKTYVSNYRYNYS